MARRKSPSPQKGQAEAYRHPDAQSPMRPEIGTQGSFKKQKPPHTYKYDSSLSPALDWDGQNAAREQGEALIAAILREAGRLGQAKSEAERDAAIAAIQDAGQQLKALSKPFLTWAGKAERLSFDVPTLPLFVHERLSTTAIIETLRGHRKVEEQPSLWDLFGDPQHSIADQVLKAYEHCDQWVNRLIVGDSVAVMNSLLRFENLGGQVQMIYMDPPYGVKFGSNFQPFVRKRHVEHNDDEDLTREPEMVQAYRDTWETGLHSYLSYLRDRLALCRELLHPSGSIFVQISDDNLHHVREILDETFGAEQFAGLIGFRKTGAQSTKLLSSTYDFLLHYAKDSESVKYRSLYTDKDPGEEGAKQYIWAESPDGKSYRKLSDEELSDPSKLPEGWRVFRPGPLTSPGASINARNEITLQGRVFTPGANRHWSLGPDDTEALDQKGRVLIIGNTPCSKLYLKDFPVSPLKNIWPDTGGSGFAAKPIYVVQTDTLAVQRCLLMTTDPGDLVVDPTCGSGTTAYIAEQWGRRWITMDVSRVPLALARQRLLTATFPWYELQDDTRGPAGGFAYKRKQNRKGEEVGGIVPHITLKKIANDEPPAEAVLVDRPETVSKITRVTGPYTVEGCIPPPAEWSPDGAAPVVSTEADAHGPNRMLEVLRKSPLLRLEGNKTVTFENVRQPAKTLVLSAEALVKNGDPKPVTFVFGPENGPVAERLVFEAAREANAKHYTHLYVIGFAIEPSARNLIDKADAALGIPATYVQATPDLLMGDLLKTMRSSQIFSVCGLPEIEVKRVKANGKKNGNAKQYQVTLLGLDVFDPVTMENVHRNGADVPAWLLDTDYNETVFHVCQAFFPRTSAWDALKKALKATHEETVWDHLAGTTSAPFEAGPNRRVSVKVIDDRGNELQVVKGLD